MNLRELLIGEPNRVRYVTRFATCHKVHNENVAEHGYFVALYAMAIADSIPEEVDQRKLLRRAILHDMEEGRTGDFPRPFKYSSESLRQKLEEAAVGAFDYMAMAIHGPGTVAIRWSAEWSSAKDQSLEGRILAFADYLAVLSYLWLEIGANNITMRRHVDEMKKYMEEFKKTEFDFIRELVDQSEELFYEAFPEY